MVTSIFILQVNNNDIWFQQEGATSVTACDTMELAESEIFKLIFLNGSGKLVKDLRIGENLLTSSNSEYYASTQFSILLCTATIKDYLHLPP